MKIEIIKKIFVQNKLNRLKLVQLFKELKIYFNKINWIRCDFCESFILIEW